MPFNSLPSIEDVDLILDQVIQHPRVEEHLQQQAFHACSEHKIGCRPWILVQCPGCREDTCRDRVCRQSDLYTDVTVFSCNRCFTVLAQYSLRDYFSTFLGSNHGRPEPPLPLARLWLQEFQFNYDMSLIEDLGQCVLAYTQFKLVRKITRKNLINQSIILDSSCGLQVQIPCSWQVTPDQWENQKARWGNKKRHWQERLH